jgi:GH24 family phage-related lysozyme (muramidase)
MRIILTQTQLNLIKESIADDPDFINYIKDVEGKVIDPKTGLHKAYKDDVGVVTIGYGHSENRDPNIKLGMKIPETKAISYLKNDLNSDESVVRNYVAKKFPGYTLDNDQLKMLVDFNYNPGLTKFPNLVKAVVTKDWNTAKKEYKRYAGGKELTDRNQKFYNLFLANKSVGKPVSKSVSKQKETTSNGSEFKTIGKTLYPRKTSKHDYANVRTEPEINNGLFDNIIETIKWPNPVGVALSKKIDDQGYTWYYVKLPEGTSFFNTNGWVRFDAITINKDEKYN